MADDDSAVIAATNGEVAATAAAAAPGARAGPPIGTAAVEANAARPACAEVAAALAVIAADAPV